MDKLNSFSADSAFVNFFVNFWNEYLYPIFSFMVPVSGIAGGIGGIMDAFA